MQGSRKGRSLHALGKELNVTMLRGHQEKTERDLTGQISPNNGLADASPRICQDIKVTGRG